MSEGAPRLLDYFAVYGLNEDHSLSLQTSNPESSLIDNFNAISSIRLRMTNQDEVLMASKTDFLYFYQIAVRDHKRLWLQIVYGRIHGKQRSSWNGRAVCKIGLYYLPSEGSYIKIPVTHQLEPVPVLTAVHNINQFSHTQQDFYYYLGNYDITHMLKASRKEGLNLVLTSCYCDSIDMTPVNDVKIVSAVLQQGPNGELKRVANIPEGYQHINMPMGRNRDSFICFKNAPNPFESLYKPELIEKFPREDLQGSPLSGAIPMFCFNQGIQLSKQQHAPTVFSFILTTQQEDSSKVPRIYITCLVFYETMPEKFAKQLHIAVSASNKVYVPKAICLISHWPYIDHMKEILREIYRLHLSTYDVPIERVICNLLQEVPLPDQGVTNVIYSIGRNKIYFSRPPPQYLPYIPDTCLEYLFRSLSVHDVITVWSFIMIQKKVLLISHHKALLTYVAMALTSLLFPFKWEQVLIPILPVPLKNYIQTIFPYIIGVSPQMLTSDIEIPIDALRVDLDTGRIVSQELLPKLPDKLNRTLFNRLMSYANIYNPRDPIRQTVDDAFNSIMKDEQNFHFDPYRIRDAFMEFQTNLLKGYQRFLLFLDNTKPQDARSCFNIQGFLSYHKARTPDNFLTKVTQTSMFADFIQSGFSAQVKYEIKYFDNAMKFKRTKNDPSFVKPYYTSESLPALYANDIGFEPGSIFRYQKFPRLNDSLFIQPRQVNQLAVNTAPKPTLMLKDDTLMRMNQGEWAKFLLNSIYKIWFYMFTLSMPRYKQHANDLMDIAVVVLNQMKKKGIKPDQEVYRRLIEACGHSGLRDRVLGLFKRMKNQGIQLDACTHGVYVKAVAEMFHLEFEEQVLSLKDLPMDSLCWMLDLERCVYIAQDTCPNCQTMLLQEDIMMGWERSYSLYTTKCPKPECESKFISRFTVIIDQVLQNQMKNSLCVEFLSPPLLRKELENFVYNHGEKALLQKDLCDKHKSLFWNMALYFDMMKIPSFFINPNFDIERLPKIIADYQKPPKRKSRGKSPYERTFQRQNSFTAQSEDNMSDSSSISGRSNHSNLSYTGDGSRLYEFVKRNKSRKSSNASDNQSTRSQSKNVSLMKVFGPYIQDFRQDNFSKGQQALAEQGFEFDVEDVEQMVDENN